MAFGRIIFALPIALQSFLLQVNWVLRPRSSSALNLFDIGSTFRSWEKLSEIEKNHSSGDCDGTSQYNNGKVLFLLTSQSPQAFLSNCTIFSLNNYFAGTIILISRQQQTSTTSFNFETPTAFLMKTLWAPIKMQLNRSVGNEFGLWRILESIVATH